MKAAIYNPYLDTLGGGERYTMAVAATLAENGYNVDIEWKDQNIKNKLEERFGIDLENINFVDSVKRGDGYDFCFWVSDGSIPTLSARKNFLHFQVPFKNVGGKTLLNKMKLFRINKVVCNSNFTKNIIDKEYGVKSVVLYPPVDVAKFKPKKKENLILSVGRFSQLKQSKRQDILVDAFKRFFDAGNRDWQLLLAGGADVGVGDLIEKIKDSARGYPIKVLQSPKFAEIKKLYEVAKIFWFASGYGIDEIKSPEKTEHFGIVVVEAMASGAIPFVYEAGGVKEIITEGENGFFWKTPDGLAAKTQRILGDNKIVKQVSQKGKFDAQKYSYEEFGKNLLSLL